MLLPAEAAAEAWCCLQNFYGAAAQSSWLLTVTGAGHQHFLEAPWLLDRAFDVLCGKGSQPSHVRIHVVCAVSC